MIQTAAKIISIIQPFLRRRSSRQPAGWRSASQGRRLVLGSIIFSVCNGLAEKPSLEHLYPTAIERGATNTIIALSGKFDPWPPRIWSSAKGLEFHFSTNKDSVQVSAAADAAIGPCLVRLFNDEGASEPAIFVVSDHPWIADAEPNDQFTAPQGLTNFPAAINGRLDKNNDVDSFAFEMKGGQWLDARLESHTLMSKVDAVLRLVTTNGYQVAWNHDFSSFDPRLVWRAPTDETVVLQVFGFVYPAGSEIRLTGGKGGVYQLHASLSKDEPADLAIPLNEAMNQKTLPLEVFGVICPAGDEDHWVVALRKDETLEVHVDAMEFGSPLDPWVAIQDANGKELARNDDADGSRDARLEWKAPADGEYAVMVGSLARQGREDWRYRLTARIVEPDYRATVEASAFVLESNSTNDVKITTKRLRNFTNQLTAAFRDLPEGVMAEPVRIDGKNGDGTLKLVATNAPAFNGPVRIIVIDEVTKEERPAVFELVSSSQNNGVPGGYSKLLVEKTGQLWLTVKEKAGEGK